MGIGIYNNYSCSHSDINWRVVDDWERSLFTASMYQWFGPIILCAFLTWMRRSKNPQIVTINRGLQQTHLSIMIRMYISGNETAGGKTLLRGLDFEILASDTDQHHSELYIAIQWYWIRFTWPYLFWIIPRLKTTKYKELGMSLASPVEASQMYWWHPRYLAVVSIQIHVFFAGENV